MLFFNLSALPGDLCVFFISYFFACLLRFLFLLHHHHWHFSASNRGFFACATAAQKTILAAAKVPEMDAGACFYGIPPLSDAELKSIKVPLICHFGNKDHAWTPEKVNALESALKQSQSKFEMYRYAADHAFMNEQRPEVYDPASAKLAWDRTIAFLNKHLA